MKHIYLLAIVFVGSSCFKGPSNDEIAWMCKRIREDNGEDMGKVIDVKKEMKKEAEGVRKD